MLITYYDSVTKIYIMQYASNVIISSYLVYTYLYKYISMANLI